MKTKVKKVKVRNPLHDHPLLQKGGVHEKPKKSLRRIARQQLKKEWSVLILIFSSRMNPDYSNYGLVAQRQEHVTVDHEDDGSNPFQFAIIEPVCKWLSSWAFNPVS